VQVRITHAGYSDVRGNTFVQLYAMAKAGVTSKPPADIGRHGDVHMH